VLIEVNWISFQSTGCRPEILPGFGENMQKKSGQPKVKCKNCEGKGLVKQGDKKMKCQRCGGTGFKS